MTRPVGSSWEAWVGRYGPGGHPLAGDAPPIIQTPYDRLIESKTRKNPDTGITPPELHDGLFPFQAAIVRWALKRGRAAVFADCGLGKTMIQLEWVRHLKGTRLIVAPLGVVQQTVMESEKLDMDSPTVLRGDQPSGDGIYITNYEQLHKLEPSSFDAVVLDESSILKSVDGKTRTDLIKRWGDIPYRMCCTATPAPNDIAELANHCEFLGVMKREEMLATFFVHAGSKDIGDNGWRLKGHAKDVFWEWMAGWSLYFRKPSDLGFEDNGFVLPGLSVGTRVIEAATIPGQLIPRLEGGLRGYLAARRASIGDRVREAASIIGDSVGPWVVWCDLNDEGRELHAALEDSVLIEGKDSEESKVSKASAWQRGETRVLITKPKIFGFGMNWQHCNQILFLGLSHSYEQYYQAIRRCWRFGQENHVSCAVVTTDLELPVFELVQRKERDTSELIDGIVASMRDIETAQIQERGGEMQASPSVDSARDVAGHDWRMLYGDCVQRIADIETGSVGLSVFSPPFAALYTYTADPRDMGNSKDYEEFFEHFKFLIPELLRVTMPGRRCCVHLQQTATKKSIDGVIGWYDLRGDAIRAFQSGGWVYDGEVCIDKDPQAQAIRTKSKALLFKQKDKDSSWSRPAMADYILLFRHPGDNPVPVVPDVSNEEWILWARPVWYGIRESDTLNVAEARSEKDERHICPLQLQTIERCVRLWSNEGEMVLSPFAGIGSEGYVAVKNGRRFTGIELKNEYFDVACRNLERSSSQADLFGADAMGRQPR